MINRTIASTFTLGLLFVLSAAIGCSDGGGSKEGGGSTNPNAPKEFSSDCGTVLDGILQNPVKADRAEVGIAGFTDVNTMVFTVNGEARKVKLLGLADDEGEADNDAAEEVVQDLIKEGPAYFFRANKDCVFKDQFGVKTFKGQLFSAKGKSFAEELVAAGVAAPGGTDCSANLVTTCYEVLAEGDSGVGDEEDSGSPTPAPTPTVGSNSDSLDESDLEDILPDEELDLGDL